MESKDDIVSAEGVMEAARKILENPTFTAVLDRRILDDLRADLRDYVRSRKNPLAELVRENLNDDEG